VMVTGFTTPSRLLQDLQVDDPALIMDYLNDFDNENQDNDREIDDENDEDIDSIL